MTRSELDNLKRLHDDSPHSLRANERYVDALLAAAPALIAVAAHVREQTLREAVKAGDVVATKVAVKYQSTHMGYDEGKCDGAWEVVESIEALADATGKDGAK